MDHRREAFALDACAEHHLVHGGFDVESLHEPNATVAVDQPTAKADDT
ncbi:hypothetical protein [Burkholderia sp. F1]